MRNPVLRLLRRALILLAILAAADRLIGAGLERMFYRQRHGDDVVTRYTIDSTKEDLLVFGSSRASHHYDTRLLEQELGMSVFNCGRDEMLITYTAAVLPLIYKRYTPSYVIIEVLPTELAPWEKAISDQRIATVLLPFANRHPDLWQTVAYAGQDEVYKSAVSKIYPYNSLIGAFIQNTYTHFGHSTDRGYEPLYKTIDSATYTKPLWKSFNNAVGLDAALAERFASLLDTAASHGTRVFVIVSPFYFSQDISKNESFLALQSLCVEHGATFMDWSFDPRFVRHPKLFNDDVHLNDSGARVYTRIIADTLKKCGVIPGRLY
jgi:hypothetical protein